MARAELEKGRNRISSTEVRKDGGNYTAMSLTQTVRATQTHAHTPSLTSVQRRTSRDVATLCVEGELVDVHFTGADQLHDLFRIDGPIIVYVYVGDLSSFIFVYPESTHTYNPFRACLFVSIVIQTYLKLYL